DVGVSGPGEDRRGRSVKTGGRLEKLLCRVPGLYGPAAWLSRQESRSVQTELADLVCERSENAFTDPSRHVGRQCTRAGFYAIDRETYPPRQDTIFRDNALSLGKSRVCAARKLDGRV